MRRATSARPRLRPSSRTVLAVTTAGVLTVVGLPLLSGTAYADKGKRCDEKYNLSGRPSQAQPWEQGIHVRDPQHWDSYDFDAPRQALDGVTPPPGSTPDEQQKFLEKLKPYQHYPEYSEDRVYAQYRDYMVGKNWNDTRYGSFRKWLSDAWILPNNNNRRGSGFEKKVVKDLGLLGPDWLCNEEVEVKDKNGKTIMVKDPKTGRMRPLVRKFDAVNYKEDKFLEFKAGPGRDTKQDLANRMFLQDPQRKNARITYVNGEPKLPATRDYLGRLAEEAGKDAQGRPRVTAYEHRSTGVPRYTPIKGVTQGDSNFSPGGANRAAGGASRTISQSPPTPKDMADRLKRIGANGPRGTGVRGPGGVDFTTLDLAYVGKPVKGKGLPYAFAADSVQDESPEHGWGGEAKARLISDSFFAWLALTPDKFWVNLNPDQPDKIMDRTFGKTDAGRVLLQADLQMKHDYARDMDPRQGIGKQFWDAAQAAGLPCSPSIRLWIVPAQAKVRADDDGLYILDAPLRVNIAHLVVQHPNPNGKCDLTEAQEKTGETLVKRYVVPDVEKAINSGPGYADLRRVYSARVAAEYVRRQDALRATDYRQVIDSGNVAKWPLRAPNRSWTPKQTWDDYMTSYTKGDYSYPCEYAGERKTCVMGGVDFSKAPRRNVSRAEFQLQHPRLKKSAGTAARAQTDSADTAAGPDRVAKTVLLGGGGDRIPSGSDDGTPTPTPTATHTGGGGQPTGHPSPSTPAPQPSSRPSGAGGHGTTPVEPGGDLAHTGSDTPIGLITGIAAAVIVVGGALVWWMRRRRTSAG